MLLACRSSSRCSQAAAQVSAHAGGGGVATAVGASLDLTDLHSVRRFASHLSKSRKTLDVLILNAGFAGGRSDGRPTLTEQGTELSLGAMHVGHALLAEQVLVRGALLRWSGRTYIYIYIYICTYIYIHALLAEQLLPMLEATGGGSRGPSRVITVASEASHLAPPLHPSLFVGKGEGDLRGEVTNHKAPLGSPWLLVNLLFDIIPNGLMSAFGAAGFSPTYTRAKYANVLYSRYLSDRKSLKV